MARKQQQRRDRISELPVDIVDKILGFLPIHEAAKMAVLSTFWRDTWFSLTKFIFDSRFLSHIMRKYRTREDSDIWVSAALYVINKVLNQHNGLIRTFVVNFQGNTRKSLKSRSFDIDQWFLFVTRKGVEDIFLSFMVGDDYRCYNLPNLKITARILDILVLNDSHFYHVPIYSNLRSLRVLELDCYSLVDFDKGCTRRELQPQPFVLNVEYLILSEYIFVSSDISSEFIHLLRTCPKLSTLDINLSFTHGFPKLRDEFHTVAQRLKVLQKLNLTEFVPCKPYVAFINRLLACFPALEEVVISITRSKRLFNVEGNKEVLDYYKDEVLQFSCCASTKVKRSFID
ncbi:putative FBD-associated F-box protein At3g60710 [Ipomoea triloba]|uniref:putative FBD-associated F-box protein At3g60710 n=1 Tax=Ipomoea triloba TaxID=35885 RepID=UPI00125CDE1F|nr:putative FBD-associated F-box protein At3g60710 [Ipomoea triloba]